MNIHAEGGDKTPLHRAASLGCTADVETMIASGSMPDAQTRRGRTALHYAAENGHDGVVRLLLRSGAQIDLPNKWGRTALHYAASKHRAECIHTLINGGADPNKQDVDCQTPLYHAVSASAWRTRGDTTESNTIVRDPTVLDTVVRDTIMLLISRGANADIPDRSGITPLHVAAELGNTAVCIHLLEDRKARVNALDQHGATALHYARYQGHRHVAELLLSHGACSTIRDNAGLLAERYAAKPTKVADLGQVVASLTQAELLLQLRNGEIQTTPSSKGIFKSCDIRRESIKSDVSDKTAERMQVREAEMKAPFCTQEFDFSSCLLQINETEGLGRVQRTVEVERIEQDISSYIEATLQGMVQVELRFNYILLKAGSTAEETKVGEPDEIDYMCCLTDLSRVSYPYASPNDPPGYLRMKIHSVGLETWKDLVDKDGFLVAETLRREFHSIFDRHSENSDLTAMSKCLHKMRDYSSNSDVGVTVDMSQTKPGSRLHFLWRGCQFKRMVVTVDLIPAIEILGWPDIAKVPPPQGCYRYHVIPKVSSTIENNSSARLFWRISTSMAEKCLFGVMDAPAIACYTICKSLIHCPDPHQLFPYYAYSASKDLQQLLCILRCLRSYDEVINSYLLKMIFFRESTKCKERSDWVWSTWSTVGDRVSELLNELLDELKEGYVPSFFLLDYNVLNIETPSDVS